LYCSRLGWSGRDMPRSDFRVESRRKEIKQAAVDHELLADSFAA
jgi:hypothetical protein